MPENELEEGLGLTGSLSPHDENSEEAESERVAWKCRFIDRAALERLFCVHGLTSSSKIIYQSKL